MKIILFTTHKLADTLDTDRIAEFLMAQHIEFNLLYVDDSPESMAQLKALNFDQVITPLLYIRESEVLINPADYKLAKVFNIQSVLDTYNLEMGGVSSVDLIDSCDN